MPHPLRRLLVVSATAAVLPILGPAHLTGPSPAMAQQEAAAETEAPAKSRGRGRERKKAVSAPGMQQATPVAIFGDWNVFANGQGKSRTCYAIAQPQARSPKTLKRDTAYLFVTIRKGDNVQNEVAVMFGFPPKPAASQAKANATSASDPTLSLGTSQYGLVVKDENAWLQNPSEEARLVGEMAKLAKVQVKTVSMRGTSTSDEYALAGFGDAMKRAREECK
ncbi:invasion associated locus b family protein [Methylobacterium sp. Leaf85]|uniref:invasion associated locus b family protein n=1 Tax=Methylobacterium sp. Leaf85 TaxID=1736241 RepID=UPI0009EC0091|nr:invasion associated locus b family protein [Methylobacterium sp. Leaf85]